MIAWHNAFDFVQTEYQAVGLSDHTPMLMCFSQCQKQNSSFAFCDMWGIGSSFIDCIEASMVKYTLGQCMFRISRILKKLNKPLMQLNKYIYDDIHSQQEIQKELCNHINNAQLQDRENEVRNEYLLCLQSSLSLMQWKTKTDWSHFGDQCIIYFFAKVKQRR
ncbi:hypothetical protein Cgig2_010800 [Carnegiea gigantea]|uniref:Endonuclease/exonuclease/phosphatase domain-containing protein n=1 Tax=Carnegiea gigantea TaxID=171969 RepID=A0A9Q1GTQ7_9CARY|nr:hypothetical protein Cgig2_010800 [Carnegiea gigantea]